LTSWPQTYNSKSANIQLAEKQMQLSKTSL